MVQRFLLLCFLCLFLGLSVAKAEEEAADPVAASGNQTDVQTSQSDSDPLAWKRILDTTEQAISRQGVTDQELDRLFDETVGLRLEANAEAQEAQAQVNQIQQQLDELGPPPAEGQPAETEQAQLQRKTLNENFANADAELKQARLAEVRSRQLQKDIADLRHKRFVQSISVRDDGLTTPKFWVDFVSGFKGFSRSMKLLLVDSYNIFTKEIGSDARKLLLLPAFLVLIGFAVYRIRLVLGALIDDQKDLFSAHQAGNAGAGLIYYLKNGVLIAIVPIAVYQTFSELGLLTQRLDELLLTIAILIGFLIISISLFYVFLSPNQAKRRLLTLGGQAAKRMFTLLSVSVMLAVLIAIVNYTAAALVSPLEVNVGLSLIFSLVVGGSALWALVVSRRDRYARKLKEGIFEKLTGFWYYLETALWLCSIVILGSVATGYVAFAEFLSQQLLFGLVVVLSAWLLLHFIDYSFAKMSERSAANAEAEGAQAGDGPGTGQAIILSAGLLKLLVYCFTGVLLMLPWGYRTEDFYEIFQSLFFGFEIGGLTISISTLLLAFFLFFVGYTATVALRNWLNNKFLPTTQLDIGVSNSISTIFGYLGFILAAVLAITAAGFDLSNLAIVAGALSVGVGFGLQSIVNNFVSGLILLAERPIKSGDWIVTAGGEGYVKKISVRSTEIETFDRATVIVPNSTLITDTVTNWTHDTKSGRIILPIGVGYDSDPVQVEEILLACAQENKMILGRPAPVVYFVDFGASSLDFQLRCYLSDINYSMSVKSDLRFNILKALRDAKIEIPYPQQDIHVRSNVSVPEKPAPKTRKARTPVRKRLQKDSE